MGITVKNTGKGKVNFYYKRNILTMIIAIIISIGGIYLDFSNYNLFRIIIYILILITATYYLFKKWVIILDKNTNQLIYNKEKIPVNNIKYISYKISDKYSRYKNNYQIFVKTKDSKTIEIFPDIIFLNIVIQILKKLENEGFRINFQEE